MKWIKASERSPEYNQTQLLKVNIGGNSPIKKEGRLQFNNKFFTDCGEFDLQDVLWLDEPEVEFRKKDVGCMQKLIEHLQQELRGVAIATQESGLTKEEKSHYKTVGKILHDIIKKASELLNETLK